MHASCWAQSDRHRESSRYQWSSKPLNYTVTCNNHFSKAEHSSSSVFLKSATGDVNVVRIPSSGHNPYQLQDLSDRPKGACITMTHDVHVWSFLQHTYCLWRRQNNNYRTYQIITFRVILDTLKMVTMRYRQQTAVFTMKFNIDLLLYTSFLNFYA